ncbi:SRPBCC family protein [Herbaspirillum sp. RTI4]|uniref:SRPBCC family protein n=1 Tax=Herbaspirillum sp. RTI4 TaxID=3048640 RepID=UPI002AB52279|nr:SRPBCC family protein [Herbaspirillum sp. RTI4]MDY7576953.1 SRPBCC family protein [Herbaspirillum sp. RTI4]MEA9982145.1 SRPBCC family protein [Herbaspirillum sp. RTI4]
MKFNHLIQINDPLLPLAEPLTRAQLWRGLIARAETPRMFVPHLDACQLLAGEEIDAAIPTQIRRTLRYGELTVTDVVDFIPLTHVHYDVPAQGEIVASSLRMTIEEPEPDMLFVRFEYSDAQPDEPGTEAAFYNNYRRSAWEAADIDTVRVIRELAEAGELG